MPQIEPVDIPASHGLLEGLLRVPDGAGAPRLAAVVCHPHPQFQGTMHNKVVFTIAKALGEAGLPALRFNFRGVGRSTGTFDEGRGEAADVSAALAWLAGRYPATPLLLAGFSFGSWVGLPVGCADPRVTRLIGVGVPTTLLSLDALPGCAKPKLIVQGDQDEYGPLPQLESWFARLTPPKDLRVIQGTGHFFPDRQADLAAAITAWDGLRV